MTTDILFFFNVPNAECRVFAEVDASLEHFLAISGRSVTPPPRGGVDLMVRVHRVLAFRCLMLSNKKAEYRFKMRLNGSSSRNS